MRSFNILTDSLPETVTLFGEEYAVHTSFQNWIQIAVFASEGSIKESKNMAKALKLCYKDRLPPNIVSACLGMLHFLNRGAELSAPQGGKRMPVFSFRQDADVIYAAFYEQYGIDLACTDLHWYQFCALFSSLAEDNPFQTLLKIRTMDERSIKEPKRRRKIAALKKQFSLKQSGAAREIDVAKQLSSLF